MPKYKFLINKHFHDPIALTEYSSDMEDVYKNIDERR